MSIPGELIATDLIAFWRDAGPGKWFNGGKAFDEQCRQRFGWYFGRRRSPVFPAPLTLTDTALCGGERR